MGIVGYLLVYCPVIIIFFAILKNYNLSKNIMVKVANEFELKRVTIEERIQKV